MARGTQSRIIYDEFLELGNAPLDASRLEHAAAIGERLLDVRPGRQTRLHKIRCAVLFYDLALSAHALRLTQERTEFASRSLEQLELWDNDSGRNQKNSLGYQLLARKILPFASVLGHTAKEGITEKHVSELAVATGKFALELYEQQVDLQNRKLGTRDLPTRLSHVVGEGAEQAFATVVLSLNSVLPQRVIPFPTSPRGDKSSPSAAVNIGAHDFVVMSEADTTATWQPVQVKNHRPNPQTSPQNSADSVPIAYTDELLGISTPEFGIQLIRMAIGETDFPDPSQQGVQAQLRLAQIGVFKFLVGEDGGDVA